MSERLGPLLIRADGGLNIGGGHIMRCLALACEWKKRGGEAVFLSHFSCEALRRRIDAAGFDLLALERCHPDPSDLDTTMAVVAQMCFKRTSTARPWVVLDGYYFDEEYQSAFRRAGYPLLVVDDRAHLRHYYANILLNQNFGSEFLRYECDPDTAMLLGTQYCLLRPEFARWHEWKRPVRDTASRVLVSLGASDPSNATLMVVKALRRVAVPQVKVRVVVGPANPNLEEIRRAVEPHGDRFQVLSDVTDMSELMAWADVAVSGAGSTCWELSFMGLPALLMVLADNQTPVAGALHRDGFAVNLGKVATVGEKQLLAALENLMLDAGEREAICSRGRELVDGLGAGRVVEHLFRGSLVA